jgi:hypothetical protein
MFKMVKKYRYQIRDRVIATGSFEMRVMHDEYNMRLLAVGQPHGKVLKSQTKRRVYAVLKFIEVGQEPTIGALDWRSGHKYELEVLVSL